MATPREDVRGPAVVAAASSARPVPFAMIGGGEDAFIGEVHRMAAALAGNCRLVAGAFSSDAARSAMGTGGR